MIASLAMTLLLGNDPTPSPAAHHWLMIPVNFILVFILGGPLGEELGWRGYVLPRLLTQTGVVQASLFLGALWSIWHIPLFYVPDSLQSHLPLLMYCLMTVALSIIYLWFFLISNGSVVISMVLHTSSNAWAWVFPVLPGPADNSTYQILVTLVIGISLIALMDCRKRWTRHPLNVPAQADNS